MMLVKIKSLLKLVNPALSPPWKEWNNTIINVESLQPFLNILIQPQEYDSLSPETPEQHLQRIAYLYQHNWTDPILLILRENYYPIADGVHRTIAAILRQDEFIAAHVEGELSLIRSLY